MVFQCQRDSYQKEFTTTVINCKPSKQQFVIDGKKKKVDCYEVTFEDTILFPEGGGQPDDRGSVNGIPVLGVLRRGGEAVHYLESSLEARSEVTQKVDWERRHDHMQQHSAQHLISAVAEEMYGYVTSSWHLGNAVSYIEFDTPTFTSEEVTALEDYINGKLRDAVPVTVKEYDASDPELKESHTRGLPEDVVGPVRVVTIDGIDSNMCCGTHVRNLADIQMIKLLYTEKGKTNKLLLHFVAGNRVIRYFGECFSRERELNKVLGTCPSDHVHRIEMIQKSMKSSMKSLKDAFKDLAVAEGQKFLSQNPRPKVYFHHRRDGNEEYLCDINREINDESVLKILTAGEDKGQGSLLVFGPQELVQQVGPKLCEIFEGRGGGKTCFKGKVFKLGRRKEAEKYIYSVMNCERES